MTPIPPRMPLEYAGSSRPIAPHSAVIPHGPRVASSAPARSKAMKAAAEQQCGVPDCNFMFPDPGDDCNEGDCKKQCDSSDGAAATNLGFLTAAAAVAAAL